MLMPNNLYNMENICKSCGEPIRNENELKYCGLCKGTMHQGCHSWMCSACAEIIFPFSNIGNNDLLQTCVNIERNNPNVIDIAHLENLSINVLELNDVHDVAPLQDVDPDINAINNIIWNNLRSHYYLEQSFNNKFKEKFGNKEPFSLFHLNVRSIPKNFNNLEAYLLNIRTKFSIVGLTETWLNKANDGLYNMQGYTQEKNYRTSKKGGGVSIYIKDNIEYIKRPDLTVWDKNIESLFIEVKYGDESNKCSVVGVIYRPPNGCVDSFLDHINNMLSKLQRESKSVYLMGDYNLNLLNTNHSKTSEFIETLFSYSFMPLINKPTRVTQTTATLIDNIFCNDVQAKDLFNGVFCTDISDHFPIFCICSEMNILKDKHIYKRRINQRCMDKFQDKLDSVDWEGIKRINNCQEAFSQFHNVYLKYFDECFPLEKMKINYKNRKPWLTDSLKNSIKVKNKLYTIYMNNSNLYNKNKYIDYKKVLQKVMRRSERNHYNDILMKNKGNIKKSWELIREIINKTSSKSPNSKQILINGKLETDEQIISNGLNDFYVNIGNKVRATIPDCDKTYSDFMPAANHNAMFLAPTTSSEVKSIIMKLKLKSPGWDGITANVLKQTCTKFTDALACIINLSFAQGIFPQEMKTAKVIPVYKGEDETIMGNYRPVSILPMFSKVFERLMYDRLISFIDEHNILYKYQFGFRQGHGTDLALITLIDKISREVDEGNNVLGVFLDFTKAFDTVDHQILLNKLELYGVRGVAHKWITNYLKDRKQYVCLNEIKSNLCAVTCGVPQGSILGPLLYLIYVNDIVNISSVIPILFADDTNIFLTGKNIGNLMGQMNQELSKLVEWVNVNKLSLNISKTKYMIFSNRNVIQDGNLNLLINNVKLKRVNQTKFLGVIIDSKLTWKEHILHVRKKISKGAGILCKARKVLNRETLITLYNSFVYPYITYGVEVWGAAAQCHIDTVIKSQKKIIRIITSSKYNAHTAPLFQTLKILQFPKLYTYCMAKMMYRFMKPSVPTSLQGMFHTNDEFHSYFTRDRRQLRNERGRTSMVYTTFRYKGVSIWNDISSKVNGECSFVTFKYRLRQQLINE